MPTLKYPIKQKSKLKYCFHSKLVTCLVQVTQNTTFMFLKQAEFIQDTITLPNRVTNLWKEFFLKKLENLKYILILISFNSNLILLIFLFQTIWRTNLRLYNKIIIDTKVTSFDDPYIQFSLAPSNISHQKIVFSEI